MLDPPDCFSLAGCSLFSRERAAGLICALPLKLAALVNPFMPGEVGIVLKFG